MSDLNEEQSVAGSPAFDIPVDDQWQEQFAGQEDAGEEPPSVTGETIPTFPYYVVRFDKGKGGFTKGEKKLISISQSREILKP